MVNPSELFPYQFDKKYAKPIAYFSMEFALWNVKKRKPEFREAVDLSQTEKFTFGECKKVAASSELAKDLEDPVKKTVELLTRDLFDKIFGK